ncbi:MAG: hypothetical protein M0030_12630 [Actinomycetota bacterium]|nr:hypothetical protein [Actinomycetota bacterium]
MAEPITPPGKGRIISCPDCDGIPGCDCPECHGQGRYIMRTCPLCGDPAWDYNNGTSDHDGMTCRNSCGYTWTRTDPGWRVQALPSDCQAK